MALTRWIGNAKAVSRINRVTPGGTIGTETFTITINGKEIVYVAESGDTATEVVDGLIAALTEYIAEPEISMLTVTDNGTTLDLEGPPGVPFTQTSSATGSATLVTTSDGTGASQLPSGPNFWSVATNWSGGSVPVSNDSVTIDGDSSTPAVLYDLDQNAVSLTELIIRGNVQVGLPPRNDLGYNEYLEQELKISATAIEINSNSSLIRINVGANATAMNVLSTGAPVRNDIKALTFRGSGSNTITITDGSLGIANIEGETAKVTTLRIGTKTTAPDVFIGEGTTLADTILAGGTVVCYADFVAWVIEGGTVTARENATGTTLTVRNSGELVWMSSGNIGTKLIAGPNGVCDFSRDLRTRTIAATDVYAGATVRDPFKVTTFTGGFVLKQCSLADVTLDIGTDCTITRS